MTSRSRHLLLAVAAVATAAPGLRGQQSPTTLGLDEALAGFHRNSPELELARSRLRSDVAASRQGRALPNPSASFTREDLGAYSERYLNLTQRVDFLWRAGPLGSRSEAEAAGARARFRADSAGLVLELQRAYVNAWTARRKVKALTPVDSLVQTLTRAARERFAEGDLAGYDVRRLGVERASVARRLARAELELQRAEERLAALVVGEAGPGRASARTLDGAPPALPAAFDAEEAALARRPEVAEALATVDAREAQAALAGRNRLAGASLTGGWKEQSDGQNGLFVGLRVPLPLLDRKGEAVAAARAETRGAESRVELVRRVVRREASLARGRLTSAAGMLELQDSEALAQAEDLMSIARIGYEEGEVGIVELLDAADAYLEARLLATDLRADAWLAWFELERAVGGLSGGIDTGDDR